MLKKGALAIALAGYVVVGSTVAMAGPRAGSAAFPAAQAPVQPMVAPAKRKVAKDAEFVAAGGLVIPAIIGGIVLVSLVVVAASGGNDSSPN